METIKTYYDIKEVMDLLGVKETTGYRIIRNLNKELESKGFITVAGKVNKKYFHERFYGATDLIKSVKA